MNNADRSEYEIAVIGIAGRFPGARNVDQFWQNLSDGVESISFFSEDELEASVVSPALLDHANYVPAGAVLDNVEFFDAPFFAFTPREAELMDPQQRFFLECAWEALETAGYDSERYNGRIGVFAGASLNTYLLNNLYSNRDLIESVGGFQTVIANDKDHLPTWVSYKLNLTGPSVNVQTACSTSLVAVHLACQSLLNHESDMALAGGVSIRVPSKSGYLYEEGGINSPDGHCRAFDARAHGTVAGEGVGVVVLKRLADALNDGDCIHAVIKGSAINNDGSLKVGYTAPSVDGQAAVIAEALEMAMVEPETITCIETHGTGTALGDPIEVAALTQAFRARTPKKGFCAIGSVKTNIGHLDAAAGVASLIKTVLALKHRRLPPSLHFDRPNPQIDFASSPFHVNAKLSEWTSEGSPRRAGVSSFGIGGTNAHVVLEEAPPARRSERCRPQQLLIISAKTSSALETATANLATHLRLHPEVDLDDVAYTLQVGRREFPHRRALVCRGTDDAVNALTELNQKRVFTAFHEQSSRPIVFMFSGQGAQYVNMAAELYSSEPAFGDDIDRCSELLDPQLGVDLRRLLYPNEQEAAQASRQLDQTLITQAALFSVEYALARLWMKWGVVPDAFIGHSIGEYVAACLAGVFSLEDGLSLIAARGKLMQQLPVGAMVAVPLSETEVRPLLNGKLSAAAVNSPSLCVVSGLAEAAQEFECEVTERGLNCRRLHTSHAFHSEMMEPIMEAFTEAVRKIELKPPHIPYLSNVSGTWITAGEATDPSYWARHMRQTVRFSEGIAELLKEPNRMFLEVGPGHTLATLVRQHGDAAAQRVVLSSLRHPQQQQSDTEFLLNTLGRLWLAGVNIDWFSFHEGERRRRVPLPTYPFEGVRYWIEPRKDAGESGAGQEALTKKTDVAEWFYAHSWKRSVPPEVLADKTKADDDSRWLVFAGERGLGVQLVKELEESGRDIVTVVAGDQFAKLTDRRYTINPRQRGDYGALLKELSSAHATPQVIAHLWNVAPNGDSPVRADSFEQSQYCGFFSLIFLAQALGEQYLEHSVRVVTVSSQLHEVTGEELVRPERATMLGPCKVIPQEYPNITCRSIDVVSPDLGTASEQKLVSSLIKEIAQDSPDPIVAYRRNHRWVPVFEPVRLDDSSSTQFRERGVYLITGLDDFSLALAEHLAQALRARVLLIGGAGFPARNQWETWIESHDELDPLTQTLRKIMAMEKAEAEVVVAAADVTDREQMKRAINETRKRFGEINGVIHSASVTGGGMIQLKTPEAASNVLDQKIKGALVLTSLFKDLPLDFLALFSSTLSITGVFGQVEYCAANAFLDAFARSNDAPPNTITINWGTSHWENWQQPVMSGSNEMQAQLKDAQETYGITVQEGVDAFRRILAHPLPQVVVSTQDFRALLEQQNAFSASSLLEELNQSRRSAPAHSRSESGAVYVPPGNEVEQIIADFWQNLFGIQQVGIHDNFFDLGGNSLLAIQLVSHLRKAFQIELPMSKLFESPSVAELARAIAASQEEQKQLAEMSRLLDEIESLSPQEVQARLG